MLLLDQATSTGNVVQIVNAILNTLQTIALAYFAARWTRR